MTAELSQYLPFLVAAGAIICIALWLLFGPAKPTAASVEAEVTPEVAAPAPKAPAPKAKASAKPTAPVKPKAAAPKAEVKSPTAKTAAPKAAKPKAAPKAAAPAPAVAKDAAPKAEKPKVPKVAVPKAAAPKAAKAAKGPDNLRLIKGLGPKLNTMLNDLGVTRFDQIAGLDVAAVAALDAKLGTFAGRITRDNFVDQAGLLAKGDVAAFEAKYGKLDGSL
jgi:predicted flap endonuclease-1-like 5' DNA nuclease